jgi:hypothetical protein
MITISRCPVEQGQMPPPTGPRRRLGRVLLHAGDCLSLLLVMALISAC